MLFPLRGGAVRDLSETSVPKTTKPPSSGDAGRLFDAATKSFDQGVLGSIPRRLTNLLARLQLPSCPRSRSCYHFATTSVIKRVDAASSRRDREPLPVGVHRELDARMAELALEVDRRLALLEQEAGEGSLRQWGGGVWVVPREPAGGGTCGRGCACPVECPPPSRTPRAASRANLSSASPPSARADGVTGRARH